MWVLWEEWMNKQKKDGICKSWIISQMRAVLFSLMLLIFVSISSAFNNKIIINNIFFNMQFTIILKTQTRQVENPTSREQNQKAYTQEEPRSTKSKAF